MILVSCLWALVFCNYGCIGNNWDALWFFVRTKKSANRGIESSWLEDNKIKTDLLGEGLLTAGIGSTLGVFLANIYGKTILDLLSGQWSGAVSGANFHYDASLSSMITGGVCATIISLLAMIWSTRKLLKREPIELLVSGNTDSICESAVIKSKWHEWAGILCWVFSLLLAFSVGLKSNQASMAFLVLAVYFSSADFFYLGQI